MIKISTLERRKTTEADLEIILSNLRDFSRNELFIVAGEEETALKQAVEGSRDVWSGYVDGELALIYGVRVISILSNHAYVWMLTTKLVEKHWVSFVRVSTVYAWDLLDQYDKVSVIAPFKSELSQRWLEYLGFTREGVTRMYGIKFRTYSITKESFKTEKLEWLRGEDRWQPLLAS